MRGLGLLARVLLGLLLLASGALKGLDPHGSVIAVGAYHLLPEPVALVAGVVLPAVEVVVGAALLTGLFVPGASLCGAGLALTFAAGVTSAMVRSLDLDCGCFGALSLTPRAGAGTLTFDGLLVLLAVLAYLGTRPRAAASSVEP